MTEAREWPDWWQWELELTPHLLKRMADRQFNEIELRQMLEAPRGWRPNEEPGRYVIATTFDQREWEVVVEPLADSRLCW
ncbi:MAG: hypothetical protein NTW87_10640 [Planctomycetota bacterium]|nr:hypothetical protein [Planctomycetota bacterium]